MRAIVVATALRACPAATALIESAVVVAAANAVEAFAIAVDLAGRAGAIAILAELATARAAIGIFAAEVVKNAFPPALLESCFADTDAIAAPAFPALPTRAAI